MINVLPSVHLRCAIEYVNLYKCTHNILGVVALHGSRSVQSCVHSFSLSVFCFIQLCGKWDGPTRNQQPTIVNHHHLHHIHVNYFVSPFYVPFKIE